MEWFGHKRFVVGIVVLSIIIGGVVLAQGPLFHGIYGPFTGNLFNDPTTTIWKVTGPNSDLSEFNSLGAHYCLCTLNAIAQPGFYLQPDGAQTSIALTKSSVGDLGVIAAKQLFYRAQYTILGGTCCVIANDFGFYLTVNKTLPTTANFFLKQDSSTVQSFSLILRSDANGQISKDGNVFTSASPFNIVTASFNLQRVGNPTGNLFAEVYTIIGVLPNGTPNVLKATSNPVAVSGVPTGTVAFQTFSFTNPLFVQANPSQYFIVVDASQLTTDANNYVITYLQNIIGTKNKADFTVGGAWTSDSLHSLNFEVDGGYYDPQYDPSVALLVRILPAGGGGTSFYNEALIQRTVGDTIKSENTPGCSPSGSCFANPSDTINPNGGGNPVTLGLVLNYTTQGNLATACAGATGGPGCSELAIGPGTSVPPTVNAWTQEIPWFRIQGEQYYAGFYSLAPNSPNITNGNDLVFFNFEFTSGGGIFMPNDLAYYVPGPNCPGQSNGPCNPDTGGFFGPLIKSLVSMGIFILNIIFGFVAFILPAIQQALGVLEIVLTQVLNFLGNLLWPGSNLGTLLAGFLNAIIQLFTNTNYGLPAFFANFPSYFTNFLAWLQITFPFLAPMFSIANAILGFAVSVVPTGVTIMTLGLQMFLFGYGTLILASFFIYTGDDGIGGFLTFLGTLEALSFKILNIIATLTNLGLDILVIIVSLIPKPLIQMSASKLPRLPTLETGASMSFPVMDLGEARNGNMVVYWLWSMGLYMLAWFESRNPSLPGSLGSIYAPLATNMRILSAYLPLLQAMVLISGGLLLAWTAMMPLRTIGFDIMGLSPFGVSLGRRTGAGPSTVKLAVGKKHAIGPAAKAEKERRRQKEFEAKKEEEARKGIVKHAKTEEEKRRSEELRKKEIERKPTGKDIKGPDLT